MPKRLFIIACESSGDTHGAHLLEELKRLHPDVECRGLGGPRMQKAGVKLLHDMTQISALGFGDVVRQYFKYRAIFYRCLDEVKSWKPDAILCIDSPAFNLRFAKKIKKKVPLVYYISPQLWAWGGGRIHLIRRVVSRMLVILPFEKDLYDRAEVPCDFVGHPLLDQVKLSGAREELRKRFEIKAGEKAIALMPGSRSKEVRRILPVMLESARLLKSKVPGITFTLVQASHLTEEHYDEQLKNYPDLEIRRRRGFDHDFIGACDFALVTSGTATLETALIGTPYFLLYKASWSTYVLGRYLIQVPFLGLANLLAGKRVIPEFIQGGAKAKFIAFEAAALLNNPAASQEMRNEFKAVRNKLGTPGASTRAARIVAGILTSPSTAA